MKKKIQTTFFVLTFLAVSDRLGWATDLYQYPEIEPYFSSGVGYSFFDLDGSTRAGEFLYLHDSPWLAAKYVSFPFPSRIHLEAEVLNENDYIGDFRYSYKDLVQIRLQPRKLFHNLENTVLRDFSDASPSIYRQDIGVDYDIEAEINKYNFRLKTPEFPLHLYAEINTFNEKGAEQQLYLGGDGYFTDPERVSKSREIDQETKEYIIGTNSHLGPIEIDLSNSSRSFTPGADKALVDHFDFSSQRPEGDYTHNVLPELKATTNTVKVHTNLTGEVVASATFSNTKKENDTSGIKAGMWLGNGEVVWMPHPKLTFSAKYRHQDTNVDGPEAILPYLIDVRHSVEPTIDRLTTALRYRPFSGLNIKAEYTRKSKEISDENAQDWHLPTETINNIYQIGLYGRAFKKVKVTARYIHTDTDHDSEGPMVNIEPERSDQGILSLTWMPATWVIGIFSADVTSLTTDNLQILDYSGQTVGEASNADSLNQRLMESLTFSLTEKLSLTESYTYMKSKVNQDLVYQAFPPGSTPFVDQNVLNENEAQSLSLTTTYLASKKLTLSALFDYTISEGGFYPSTTEALTPESIAIFSKSHMKEMAYGAEGRYEFDNGLGLDLRCRYAKFEDESFDSPETGNYFTTLLLISKKW
ncbi:MAG: hypothetical protein MUO63_03310 [Desulfobulbaceae bacterium]|nr:hypothetical protein [Desulfobulbaceae bacterium]